VRIVFDVTTCAKPHAGGIGNYGRALVAACALHAPQHEYVLALRPNRWLARGELAGLLPQAPRRLLADPLAAAALAGADVLHAIGVRLPPRGRVPQVVTLHDLNVLESPELSTPEWRARRTARIRQTLQRADRVLSYSDQGARSLHALLGFPRERVAVVPPGVDAARFARPPAAALSAALARHGLDGAPYVLSLGALSERKNQRGLLAAFARAARSGLPSEWRLVLGGPRGDDAASLREHARQAGLPDARVLLPGFLPEADLPAVLAGAAIYCCASLHEGFGLPVLEAQAAGAPVLSSDRGALPETVGDCGVLFDPRDEAAFADALLRLARDEAGRAALAQEGPARVARDFRWDDVARRTLAVHAAAAGLAEA